MTLRLTNSEMSTWRRCKRKWYVTTYRRLEQRGEKVGALWLGSLVHDALAAYYNPDPKLQVDPTLYIAAYAAKLPEMFEDKLFLLEEAQGQADLAKIMVEGYLEWVEETGADQDLVIQGVERFAEVPMAEGVTLLSKLDAPVFRESDGAYLALEHKTTGSLDDVLQKSRLDSQLLTEHLVRFKDAIEKGATTEEAYDQCHGILLNMLRKVKRTARANPPFYGRELIPHNIHELRNHWHHVMSFANEIQQATARLDAGESHQTVCPPNSTSDCSWDCPLYKICHLADDGSDFEGALGVMFQEHDPLERYLGSLPL